MYLMVITTVGNVFVWDMKCFEVVVRQQSLLPLIRWVKVSITKIQLTGDGLLIISLSTQCSYTFNTKLGVWMLIDDRNDMIQLSANLQTQNPHGIQGLLASLQGNHVGRSAVGHLPRLYARDASQQRLATVAYLENQVAAALACQSPDEYHHWLLSYVKCLTSQGLESQLRELCLELIGPPGQSARRLMSLPGWEPLVLGLSKRSLVNEMLPVVAANNNLHRLVSEMQELLN
ncbi:protein HIRA-like [Corticium candelabrum]|uniref:protein HIRA-like n=1 Tax=Corticium candelabrum TaxID=121492 RepID=UPI002E273D59|nr:protein HIRA-like [Corticium candelabrum]